MLKWKCCDEDDTIMDLVDAEDKTKSSYGTVRAHVKGADWTTHFPTDREESGSCDTLKEAKMTVERRMMCYPLTTDEPAIGCYNDEPHRFGEIIGIRRFKVRVNDGDFTDDDGHGRPMCDGKLDSECLVRASTLEAIPEDATHIQWYNK